jgi:hypothetical protein
LHSAFEITPTISPAFSPGSEWLAFPAQARKSSVVELFVARYDGQMVVRVSNLEYKVHDYLWLDDRTLVFAVQWPDGTFHYWRARLEGNVFQLEALP